MTFRVALSQTPHVQGALKPGLHALRPEDKPHIQPEDPRSLTGSVDVDTALTSTQPNAPRWDFAIGYQHTNRQAECIYWVELHTADDHGVTKVLAKLQWLKAWLAGDGRRLRSFERDFIWVSSGRTSFTLSAPQRKQFSQLGLQHAGGVLRIPSKRP